MIVRCWGARGSVPVSGKEYEVYGGDTTCVEIRTRSDEIIIVDAGSGVRRLGNKLLEENRYRYNMVFTHAHWDHILGFPFFRPIYSEETSIDVYGCTFAQGHIKQLIAKTMTPPFFPIRFDEIKAGINYHMKCEGEFFIDSVKVSSIMLSHPNMGLGYRFEEDGKSFVFLTDNELHYRHRGGATFEDYLEFSMDADLLVHDAEFTKEEYESKKTWGHSHFDEAVRLAIMARVKKFALFHHNQDRTDEQIDEIVRECRTIIERSNADIQCFAASQYSQIQL